MIIPANYLALLNNNKYLLNNFGLDYSAFVKQLFH